MARLLQKQPESSLGSVVIEYMEHTGNTAS